MKNLVIVLLVCFSLLSCAKIELGEESDAFFHVNYKGAQMPVLVEGNVSSGKFIVVVHGGPGGSGFSYASTPSIDKLEDDFAVVYYSQRLSDGVANVSNLDYEVEPTRAQFAEDLNAIISSLKYKYGESSQFYLLGHSWGGELVSEFMSTPEYQEHVNGMINVAGHLYLSDTEKERYLYMRELLMEIAVVEIAEGENLARWQEIMDYCESIDTSEILNHGNSLWNIAWYDLGEYLIDEGKFMNRDIAGYGYDHSFFVGESDSGPTGQSSGGVFVSELTSDMLTPGHVTERKDQSEAILNITKPSLIIAGKYDGVVPPKLSIALYDGISTPLADKFYIEMDSTGHQPFDRGPDFYNLVYDFVSQY